MATLVAVNVGLPQDVPWRGQLVHTGIWKESVAGPQMVRRLNIDGDGQGDLAGPRWRAARGARVPARLVSLLGSRAGPRPTSSTGSSARTSRSTACPTTRCASATATGSATPLFEVTQPRVTCYRVGIRMGEPQMAALLVEHGRPGFYLRVLTEGVVQAGDEIVKVAVRPRGDDRRRDRRVALPARTTHASRSRAPCASPRSARAGRPRSRPCSTRPVDGSGDRQPGPDRRPRAAHRRHGRASVP